MALFPLHMWMPAAYQHAPAVSASLMAPLVTKVSAYALIRVLFWVFTARHAAATGRMLLDLWPGPARRPWSCGGVLAFVQNDLRRLLAYSSIGQMGIVALGIGLANTGGPDRRRAAHRQRRADEGRALPGRRHRAAALRRARVDDLSRLRGRAPWTAAAVAVAGLSLVGMPPLSGFFGKWYVLSGALADGRWGWPPRSCVGSLASVGYVFRIIERLFFTAAPAGTRTGRARDRARCPVACVVLAAVIVLGLGNERRGLAAGDPGAAGRWLP
jgi:multicomponent Na+:H+ antiporter subunit D